MHGGDECAPWGGKGREDFCAGRGGQRQGRRMHRPVHVVTGCGEVERQAGMGSQKKGSNWQGRIPAYLSGIGT